MRSGLWLVQGVYAYVAYFFALWAFLWPRKSFVLSATRDVYIFAAYLILVLACVIEVAG